MDISFSPLHVNRNISVLPLKFQQKLSMALAECHDQGYPMAVFEAYRSPERQDLLYGQGRTAPGPRITRARAWESWHQYYLACDIAYKIGDHWSWEGDFDKPLMLFQDYGFELISDEHSHIQITAGLDVHEAYEIYSKKGLNALFELVLGV